MRKDTKTSKSSLDISKGKRILFNILLILIALVALLIVEGILRLSNYGGDLRLFVSAPEEVSNYFRLNPDIGNRYFYQQFSVPDPTKDLFLKKKPENCYRIFVLGGSTTAGFPYGNNLMFPRILWRRLQDQFPEKRIEVVNTAMAAINSYTILDFTDEILDYEPDLILIYAGHNEFYGALGVASLESIGRRRSIIKIYLKMQHLRLFRLLRTLISKVRSASEPHNENSSEDPTATLMERIVSEQYIPLGSKLYEQGKKQFRANLEEILKTTHRAKVPVVLSELVSNVGDQPPFQSLESDTFPPAEQIYIKAQKLEARGDYTEAKKLYFRAKDLDALRFRATENFNSIILELASKYNITVVPMKQIFEKNSPHEIIGNRLMLEHLHPNTEGNFLMAEGFYQTLKKKRYISTNWDSTNMQSFDEYKKNWGMTSLDTVYGNLSIRWLKGGWPFQPKESHNTSLETYIPRNRVDSMALKALLLSKTAGIEMGHLDLANYYRKHKEYQEAYREYRALIYTIPHETIFYEGAAEMLFKLNREEEALSILEESLRIRKNDFAIKHLARLYLKQGNVNKAASYCTEAGSPLKKDPEFLNTLAHVYISKGQIDGFRKVLKNMQSLKTASFRPIQYKVSPNTRLLAQRYNAVSRVFLKEKDFNIALVLLTQSLSLEETGLANKWVGQIFLFKKDFNKALHYLQKAEAMGMKEGDLYYNLAATNYYLDKKEEAIHYLRKLEKIKPDHPDPSGLLDKLNPD